jgi:excisionase family DNA binding protein
MPDAADKEPALVGPFIKVPEAARIVGVSPDTMYAAIAAGQIPCLRIGRVIRLRRDVIEGLGRGEA